MKEISPFRYISFRFSRNDGERLIFFVFLQKNFHTNYVVDYYGISNRCGLRFTAVSVFEEIQQGTHRFAFRFKDNCRRHNGDVIHKPTYQTENQQDRETYHRFCPRQFRVNGGISAKRRFCEKRIRKAL